MCMEHTRWKSPFHLAISGFPPWSWSWALGVSKRLEIWALKIIVNPPIYGILVCFQGENDEKPWDGMGGPHSPTHFAIFWKGSHLSPTISAIPPTLLANWGSHKGWSGSKVSWGQHVVDDVGFCSKPSHFGVRYYDPSPLQSNRPQSSRST